MTEEHVIAGTARPATRKSIAAELSLLGVQHGMTLLVHSSLSELGWVCGGAQAVVLALCDVIGSDGTLVMPTHTSELSDPVHWNNPPVPTNWWTTIRAEMPAFSPELTPTRKMGKIVEVFRTLPGVLRSQHPHVSFAACGPNADNITANHQLNFGLGDGSPLARVYDLSGHVLLLGVGHDRNTSLHLCEHRLESSPGKQVENGVPVLRDGRRQWIHLQDLELFSGDFEMLGEAFSRTSAAVDGQVGQGRAELIPQRELVDFGIAWMDRHR